MNQRRPDFERTILVKAMTGLDALSLQERLAISLGRLKAQRGLTNKQLAASLGVTEAYVSQITRAMRDIKSTTIDKMMREWHVSFEELFTVTEDDLTRIEKIETHRSKGTSEERQSSGR